MQDSQGDAGSTGPTRRGFLDYYGQRDVIPVQQVAAGIDVRRRQRLALYRTLGVPVLAFRGSRVVEFGPGTGDNSEIVAELGPASYDLVDGNDASIRALEAKLADGRMDPRIVRVVRADFNADRIDGVPHGGYDVVIAEGCIPGQVDPVGTLQRISSYVAPGGALLVTTVDEVSMLAEFCCKIAMAPILASVDRDFERAIALGSEVFGPHFATLASRSRGVRDWIIDVLLHPLPPGWAVSVDDVLRSLDEFEFLGSSPAFSTDWRWYKSMGADSAPRRELAAAEWASMRHCTLDHRVDPRAVPPLSAGQSRRLRDASRTIDALTARISDDLSLDLLSDVDLALADVAGTLEGIAGMEGTVASIGDFRRSIHVLADGRWDYPYREFLGWFGRGQQNLALVRAD